MKTELAKADAMGSGIDALVRPAAIENFMRQARGAWKRVLRITRRQPRKLRLCENLPLGDRRFVAVVEYEQSRFLVGGTSASLVLLARLESNAPAAGGSARNLPIAGPSGGPIAGPVAEEAGL